MENAVASRCCGRPKTTGTRRQSGNASSRRTAASRPHPERSAAGGLMPAGSVVRRQQLQCSKGIAMDTVTAISERRLEAVPTAAGPASTKMLTVTATYLLSEDGRKASLLDGGDGKAVQQLSLQVPANRLHLVTVDAHGVARLKLKPQYRLDGDNGTVRVDAAPTYDAPPEVEELFREAARNHQLERAYHAERQTAKVKRREADQERRAAIAKAFLADPARRALVHPTPSPKRCLLETEEGRVFFDADTDVAPARDVPAEAHRRFRADLRAKRECNLKTRSQQLAQHEEKKRFAAEWIATHGTADQQARQAAGVLPLEEVVEAMTDYAFAAIAERQRYVPDGVQRLQELLKERRTETRPISRDSVLVRIDTAETMTAAQWALINEFRMLLPEATIALRSHNIASKTDASLSIGPFFGVLVTQRVGPFTIRREYAAPESTNRE